MTTEERFDRLGNHFKLRALLPSSDILLLAVGILLLGAAVAVLAWMANAGLMQTSYGDFTVFNWSFSSATTRAAYSFLCVVFGLSGLVCAVLGLVRLLARKKGT